MGAWNPTGGDGTGPSLSDSTPAAPGTAAAGVSTSASRSDHVHALPSVGPGAGTIGGGGTYVASVTLDAQGRVTSATTDTPGGGGLTHGGSLLATVWDGGITTAGKFPPYDGVVVIGAATAGSAMRRVLPAGSRWKIRAAITGAPGSGNTVKFEIQTSASLGGTFSADAASAVTFTNSDGANAIKTGSTFTVGGSAVIATIRAIATGADYVAPNQASVQLDPA